jgi:hypothetical protein
MAVVKRVTVRAIRPGLARLEADMAATYKSPSASHRSKDSGFCAANGLIVVVNRGSGTVRLTRIGSMKGRIYPVAVGNQFSFTSVYRDPGGTHTIAKSCKVTRKLNASAFHADLAGGAYVAECDARNASPADNVASTRKYAHVFFEALGLWLNVDPTSPRQTLARTERATIRGEDFRATESGTLKAFTLAR